MKKSCTQLSCCRSEEWNYIPDDQKEEMGLTFTHDGEFWCVTDCQLLVTISKLQLHVPLTSVAKEPTVAAEVNLDLCVPCYFFF